MRRHLSWEIHIPPLASDFSRHCTRWALLKAAKRPSARRRGGQERRALTVNRLAARRAAGAEDACAAAHDATWQRLLEAGEPLFGDGRRPFRQRGVVGEQHADYAAAVRNVHANGAKLAGKLERGLEVGVE